MLAYERVCLERRPSWVVVVGDVNATAACALVAKKLCLPLAHLEAGLRSGDRTMPEEINRLVTDAIADLLWTPSPDADDNLRREGVAPEKIECVGNIMIDSFEMLRRPIAERRYGQQLGLTENGYAVVTMHRPANVDDRGDAGCGRRADRVGRGQAAGRVSDASAHAPASYRIRPAGPARSRHGRSSRWAISNS